MSSTFLPVKLTTISEFEGQHTALMEMKLVLVRLVYMENFHVAALHAHSQPLPSWAVAKGEDLQEKKVLDITVLRKLKKQNANKREAREKS